MTGRLSLAHAFRTSQTNFTIHVHGENPPALPVARKGKDGRLFRRPQQAYPAATVADFRTAVLNDIHYETELELGRPVDRRRISLMLSNIGATFNAALGTWSISELEEEFDQL
jgi:hypothetical protein